MDEGPEREASAKLAQHLAVAVQVAEAVIRLRQQHIDNQAAGREQAAAAARAERTAQHAADRVVWSPALDPEWTTTADLGDLGRAWGAAAGWADTDPTADVAADRVETRLSEMAPNAMARFDELRETGTDRVEAMRDVLARVVAESRSQPEVFVAEGRPRASTTDAQAHANIATYQARRSEHTPDDPTPPERRAPRASSPAAPRRNERGAGQSMTGAAATDRQVGYIVDLLKRSPDRSGGRPTDPGEIAKLTRADASAYIQALSGGDPRPRRATASGYPHPADVAADSYPHPFIDVPPATTATKTSTAPATAARSTTRTLSR